MPKKEEPKQLSRQELLDKAMGAAVEMYLDRTPEQVEALRGRIIKGTYDSDAEKQYHGT